MKKLGHSVDLQFPNTPRVDVRVAIHDAVTDVESVEVISFIDEEARDICEMVPNPAPRGRGLVATGNVDLAKLEVALAARLAETPQTLAARVRASEDARRIAHNSEIARAEAVRQKEAAEEATAALNVEIAEKLLRVSLLDDEIAAKTAEAG